MSSGKEAPHANRRKTCCESTGRRHNSGVEAPFISERKQAEAAVRQSEAKYRRLYESMMDAFVSADLTGRIQECNFAFQTMLGYSEAELRQLTYMELTPAKWHAVQSEIVAEQVLPLGYSKVYEKEYRRKDGTVFPVELRTFLIRDATGQPETMWAIVRDITERKRMEAELRGSREALRALFARMERAREEERASVARDMHDDVGQNLTALKMDLRAIERTLEKTAPELAPLKTRATAAIEMVDAAATNVQELALKLRPSVLDRLGLEPAIRFEARRFATRSGIKCRTQATVALPALPPDVVTALFRAFQECLTNVSRHANATRVAVRLQVRGPDVLLTVQDNGSGISDAAISSLDSLGLLGIRERAAMLGGEAVFRRGRDRGTVVTVRIPATDSAPATP